MWRASERKCINLFHVPHWVLPSPQKNSDSWSTSQLIVADVGLNTWTAQPLINSLHRASVWSTFLCALIDDYVACYLPVGCRRYDLVRSFTTLTKLHAYKEQFMLYNSIDPPHFCTSKTWISSTKHFKQCLILLAQQSLIYDFRLILISFQSWSSWSLWSDSLHIKQ